MMPRAQAQTWYSSWFDTPYYHILYRHRDQNEAQAFISKICQYLALNTGSMALDLACGKGRHARVMAEQGLHVTGLDLSPSSIAEASQSLAPNLSFHVHDMREVWKANHFDVVFNIFTSFGYFEDQTEDEKVVRAIHQSLKAGGLFVFDYLNAHFVEETFIPKEEKIEDDIHFFISRHITADWVIKQISFVDKGIDYTFYEKVRNYKPEHLAQLLTRNGFEILRSFGDYSLGEPSEESPRCIFIARRL